MAQNNDNNNNTLPPAPLSSTPWKSCFRYDLFDGKVALVTGGGTGIGRAIATELASLGATVVIASRNKEKCQMAASEMNDIIRKQQLLSSNRGRVVAGPSTSIRKEEDVKNLVSCLKREEIMLCLHVLLTTSGEQSTLPLAFVCFTRSLMLSPHTGHWICLSTTLVASL